MPCAISSKRPCASQALRVLAQLLSSPRGVRLFLQDRFCTAKGLDTQRLYYLAGKLDTAGGPIQSWKLKVSQTAKIAVPEASVP
jgi:hypothetical protein